MVTEVIVSLVLDCISQGVSSAFGKEVLHGTFCLVCSWKGLTPTKCASGVHVLVLTSCAVSSISLAQRSVSEFSQPIWAKNVALDNASKLCRALLIRHKFLQGAGGLLVHNTSPRVGHRRSLRYCSCSVYLTLQQSRAAAKRKAGLRPKC